MSSWTMYKGGLQCTVVNKYCIFNPIQTGLFFASCNRWVASEAPRYNFKTSHAMAPKITQKNVLIISNFWG